MTKRTFLIVGGGIAGLTTAIALQQIGEEVQVYERFPAVLPAGSGLTIAPNALKALERIGLANEIIQQGQICRSGMSILSEKGTLLSELNDLDYGFPMISIHRAQLHRILLNALKPGTVILGKACLNITYEPSKVIVTFEDQSKAIGDYLLAADGIHSVIRKQLFTDQELRYAGYTCWRGVADCWPETQQPDRFTETWGPQGRFGVIPLPDEKTYWYALLNGAAKSRLFANYRLKELLAIFGTYHAPIKQILSSTTDDMVIHNDIYDIAPLPRLTDGRTLLLGDAAHAITPNLGQGACQAIEDGIELARCLQQHLYAQSAFSHFEKIRTKRTSIISMRSLSMGKLAQLENPLLCCLRNGLMRLVPPSIQTKQLDLLYDVNFSD